MGDNVAVEGSGNDVVEGSRGKVADGWVSNAAQVSKERGGGSGTEKKSVVVSHGEMKARMK